jgi:AraC-like DNA-binding protein
MSAGREADRLSRLVRGSLEEDATAGQLARRAYRSRAQFFRVFAAMIAETPAAMRRRLLLERAAWELGRTGRRITDIALDAHYGSLEAFTRAFCRAFKIPPSLYRRMGATHFHVPAPNAIHFCAPASASQGGRMDLYDIFAGADSFHVRRLLEHARGLTDAQLDIGSSPTCATATPGATPSSTRCARRPRRSPSPACSRTSSRSTPISAWSRSRP